MRRQERTTGKRGTEEFGLAHATRLRTVGLYCVASSGAAVFAIGLALIAMSVIMLAVGASGVGGFAMAQRPVQVALEDGASLVYLSQLVSVSFFGHTAGFRFAVLPAMALVAFAIAASAAVAVRLIGGSTRERMRVALLMPIPYALLLGLGARYLPLRLTGPFVGRNTAVVPAGAEALLLPLAWALLFAPAGGLVGVFGRGWRREGLRLLGPWATPLRSTFRALAAGLALTSVVVIVGAPILVARSGLAHSLVDSGGFGHVVAVVVGVLLVLPSLVVTLFLACFGVSFDWRVDALSHTHGSGSILGGTLPTIGGESVHQMPALLAVLLVLVTMTVVCAGWLAARRSAQSPLLDVESALRAGVLMTAICWLFALLARVDVQAGGYLGAHFEVQVASLLWRVPLWCLLGSLTGGLMYVASRGASYRRELAVALLDAARPSGVRRLGESWLEAWRVGLPSRAAVAASFLVLPVVIVGIGSAGASTSTGHASFSLAPISQAAEQRLRADTVPGSRLAVSVDPHSRVVDSANVRISLAALGVSHRQSPVSKAKAMLARDGDLFGLAGRPGELGEPQVVKEPITKTQHIGMTHVYFTQMADGLPVYGGSIGVHISRDGMHVDYVSGSFVPDVSIVEDKVAIDRDRAVALAKVALPGALVKPPHLAVYAGRRSRPSGPTARLAWFVWLSTGPLRASKEYVIDAVNGSILDVFDRGFHARTVLIYSAKHLTGTLPGTVLWKEGEAEPTDTDAKNAEKYLKLTWEFFTQEERTPRCASYDCKGELTTATVHYGKAQEYEQAEWNPQHQEIVYGDGWPAALDITAHEYSDGVAEHMDPLESNEGETGALKEGWADAMGKAVEGWVKRPSEELWAEPSWVVGELLPHGGLRNLKEPHKFEEITGHPDPEKLSEYVPECIDNKSMHENSTIIGHAFYLLATKIGIKEATRIFYRMQMFDLVKEQEPSLEMAHGAAIAAAEDLFGKGTTNVLATEEAFKAVGLNGFANPSKVCTTTSECSAGAALAAQEPANGTASTVSMLATLYRARGKLAQPSRAGHHFMPLYEEHMGRITELVSFDPTLQEMTVSGLKQVTPALEGLVEGKGEKFKLSTQEMAQIEAALKRLAQDDRLYSGGGSLAKLIEHELKWLRLPTYSGMTYAAGFKRLNDETTKHDAAAAPPPVVTLVEDPNCEKPYTNEFQIYGFNVHTPGHSKPGEVSPVDATGVACGAAIEKLGERKTCMDEGTLNKTVSVELPPGDRVRSTKELANGSYIGKVSGRAIGCAGDESRVVFGSTEIKSLEKWTSEQCPTAAIACYEGSAKFITTVEGHEAHAEGHSHAWVTEEAISKRLVITTAAAEVEAEGPTEKFKMPTGYGQFEVELCALAGEPGTKACGTSSTAWVHENGLESQPGCPTENGRYLASVTNVAGKTSMAAQWCVYWGEEAHKQTVDSGNSIGAVSCVPESTECVVADNKGNELYSTNVSATAASTWTSWSGPASPAEAIACPSSSLCTLAAGKVGSGGNMLYATSFGGTWSKAFEPTNGVLSISCPSSSFCVDGQESGSIRYSTKPASTEWTTVNIGSGSLNGVFCLSSSFCAAVNSSGHLYVANTAAKVKEATGWKATEIDGTTALHGVACTTTTSCVAVDGVGNILDLTINGSGEATVAKHDIDASNDLTAVACTPGSVCVAVDSKGNVLVSSSGGQTWNDQHMLGASTDLTSVSCASMSLCVTADTSGKVTAFTPFGVPPSQTQAIDAGNSLNAVSCVPNSTAECVVSDSKGNAQYATNVSGTLSATWKSWTGPASPSEAVSCPTSSLCVLADGVAEIGSGGKMYYATSLGGSWTEAFNPADGVLAVSCPSSSFCVSGQAEGFIRYTSKPASTEWFGLTIGSSTMSAVDCLSSAFCAVVDRTGHIHVANTEAKIKETAGWKSTDVDGTTALRGIACTSTTSCIAVDGTGSVLNLVINGSGEATATKAEIDGSNSLTAITCTGATCVAVDSQGDVLVSSNGGATWTNEHALGTDLTSVSCATSAACVATDTTGDVTAFQAE